MDKGAAQGRRFGKQDKVAGNYPHDGFGGKGSILEVGGAYLFEKPQSRIRRILRFPDVTKDDDGNCDNDALCDSGTYNTDNAYCKPNNSNEVCYKPNTS
jgi:hypothetical protein